MITNLPFLFEAALRATMEANAEILRIYNQNRTAIDYKADESPVTQADINASRIICEHLERTGLPVVCEETKHEAYSVRKSWKYFWLVDPLDGTKEFISRNGEFTVNIALIYCKNPIFGMISIPVQGIIYWGDMLNGAFKISTGDIKDIEYTKLISQGVKLPITLPEEGSIKIMTSRSHADDQTLQYIDELKKTKNDVQCIVAGSSLKFCYIAEGKADIYLRYSPTMEWDTAAGHAICLAAGAKMVSLPLKQGFYYNKKSLKNKGFMVCMNS